MEFLDDMIASLSLHQFNCGSEVYVFDPKSEGGGIVFPAFIISQNAFLKSVGNSFHAKYGIGVELGRLYSRAVRRN